MRKPLLSSELLASRLAFEDGIYVVGPFASRVSFSSQQRRSMSLVCDINEDLKAAGDNSGLTNKKICIVGAGIGGLTCAATAAALGGTVYIYEKSERKDWPKGERPLGLGEVLATIRQAEHRDAHPSLNFWPYEPVEPFTRLPILNWHESDCTHVAGQIVSRMNDLMENPRLGHQIIGVRNGCTVTGLKNTRRSGSEGGQWRLDIDVAAGADPPWDLTFDIVIFALGFGSETSAPGMATPSYWTPVGDAAAKLSQNPPAGIDHYVVSGTGDGGLIEALRLTFKNRRPGNIDDDTLRAVTKAQMQAAVSAVENRAYKVYVDHVLHGSGGPLPATVKDEIAVILWEGYNALIPVHLSDQALQALARKWSGIQPVRLLGLYKHPMELAASPFHRLLTTIACRKNWIEYTQITTVDAVPRAEKVTVGLGKEAVEVELADVRATLPAPKGGVAGTLELSRAFFVARHGYNSPLKALWPGNPANSKLSPRVRQVSRQQSLYADQDRLRPDYARTIALAFDQPDPADPNALYKYTRQGISQYFEDRFGLGVKQVGREPPRFELVGIRPGAARTAVPMTLYGCEILDRTTPAKIKDFGARDVDDGR